MCASISTIVFIVSIGLILFFLPDLLVINNPPTKSDAIIILGGDHDGSRLRHGIELLDQGWASHLALTTKQSNWAHVEKKFCPECQLENRTVTYLNTSTDTRTDAQQSLVWSLENGFHKVLVVTSPYHTRRSQFVFDDIYHGSGIEAVVVNSGSYGHLLSPGDNWWLSRATVETVWLEFGKILYWKLTPFMEGPWKSRT